MARLNTEPLRGDLVEVSWVDIFEDPTGDPDEAELSRRTSIGYYWSKREDRGVEIVVTTTTQDEGGPGQQGYCVYPSGCITQLKIIKRARRVRTKKAKEGPTDAVKPK